MKRLAILVALSLSGCIATTADAHLNDIKNCIAGKKKPKLVREYMNSNGLYSEEYDRNGDGQTDLEAMSYVHGTDAKQVQHAEHPFIYVVDDNYDGLPDRVLIDKSGAGKCSDIVLYVDLKVPHHKDTDHMERGTAKHDGLQDSESRG